MTAVIALVYFDSHQRDHDPASRLPSCWSSGTGQQALRRFARFPGTAEINAEVTGRLTESLSGVRW